VTDIPVSARMKQQPTTIATSTAHYRCRLSTGIHQQPCTIARQKNKPRLFARIYQRLATAGELKIDS
jgi:hypothetical protein